MRVTTGTGPLPAGRARGGAAVLDGAADFASVNWRGAGARRSPPCSWTAASRVEAGLWHADAVDAWLASPLRDRCFRVLLELPDGLDEAQTDAEAARLLERMREPGTEVLLHGKDLLLAGAAARRPAGAGSADRPGRRAGTARRDAGTGQRSTRAGGERVLRGRSVGPPG